MKIKVTNSRLRDIRTYIFRTPDGIYTATAPCFARRVRRAIGYYREYNSPKLTTASCIGDGLSLIPTTPLK